ncbi:bifunctional diguanylate cyclase/phosphodiesterase [Micromonospora sp. WMMA1998]|uniref:putative bifunctional diguanylate cyclase/phosphodiesterase n=1 Tax=Micromonospora sp. WMMA1998 TaxID=3015167 RepID=UPI00248CE677|nr:bifunctional diguanylate cyclase/phosphodiesterase [Micromonospora sp. WMMA1998]WBC12535.1 bifunctional diguanylate cyclase/phosphodiesterase [Micromonospora sp. WMMA1998]
MNRRDHPTRRRPSEDAWIITAPLALLAVACSTATGLISDRPLGAFPQAALLLIIMIAVSSRLVGVVVRRQSLAMSLTEVPLVLALYFLPPLSVVTIYTLSSLVTHLRHRLPAPKLWFNVARAAAGASLGTLVLTVLPRVGGVGPYRWLGICLAVAMVIAVSAVSIAAVHTLLQGWQAGRETIRALPSTLLTSGINVSAGLIVLLLINESWWSLVPLAALAAGLTMVYRSYKEFFQQHRTLSGMYELSRAVSTSGPDGTLADALLGRVRALMQAEYATLWLPAQGRHPETLLTARVEDSGLLDTAPTPATLRQKAVEAARPVTVGRGVCSDPEFRADLAERDVKDTVVVPLRSGRVVIGTLEVTNRLGDPFQFSQRDVALFETVAAHAAVALENSRLVDRLRHDAEHDTLTKLPNRRRITAAVAEAVKIGAPDEVVALLLFDVDRLRQVNESLGHAAGDKVLVEVAERLRACAPSSALVGRAGGDEFLVTLRLESTEAALELAAQLREQIRDEMVFDGLTLDVDTAVGVTVHPDHGSDAVALLQRVDLAATAAKSVPGSVQLYSPALESRSLRRLGLAGDLRRALDEGELEVYFQPKVTLRDRRLVGVECLARWEHPAHGTVAPDDFVSVAEHTGQLGRLTEFVLRESLRRSRDWSHGDQPLSVSVNLAARTLTDQHFPALVRDLLAEYGVPPQRLTLEITEAGVLDGTERPIPTLRSLRDLGVRLSVDDFGTGNSSLAQLRRLPVHEVKVDRSFVQGMATDPSDLAIVNAVVTLSQQFGLTVVAEGVESELTLELLQDIGCEIGQGFLFSRPLPYERLETWFGAQVDPETVVAGELPRLRVVP